MGRSTIPFVPFVLSILFLLTSFCIPRVAGLPVESNTNPNRLAPTTGSSDSASLIARQYLSQSEKRKKETIGDAVVGGYIGGVVGFIIVCMLTLWCKLDRLHVNTDVNV
ncbi:hypothetical protein BJ508DRAFT_302412 [Ascobolus immersus RN42]|uniref:Transmembrane protein n=1 Tax=Ascobolus immersus RN42 TaxID=1160509 RepID=A0A3N4IWN3_ASCIM|nr:hypothetical protein BJ508DRAFT_302412 [Ascobolus immersus RN42]